jgi:hypothetical protein
MAQPPRGANAAAAGPATAPDGRPINAITGLVQTQESAGADEMTEEEREAEAERLFALFDRLERTGALPPERNPIRQAIQRQG